MSRVRPPLDGRATGPLIRSLGRYGLATAAPAAVSAAQFVMQMALLKAFDAASFGLFAFMLTLIQFGYGVSNALISTPYTVSANQKSVAGDDGSVFFSANLVFAVAWGLVCAGSAVALDQPSTAPVFGLMGLLSMVRWFGRAHLYALHRPAGAAAADLVYSASLLVLLGLAWFTDFSAIAAGLALCGALGCGLAAIGFDFLRRQLLAVSPRALLPYRHVWREQARWTIVGVATTEATANAHSYLVTLFAGPAALAPIAAASLFIKPVAMVVNSLTQLERPVMAREIGAGRYAEALETNRLFRLVVSATWAATVAAALAVICLEPGLVLKSTYDPATILVAFAFWAVIGFMQAWSMAGSILLQGAGLFRPLALASARSAGVSLAAAVAFLAVLGPIYSLAGIVLGQAVMSLGIIRIEAEWRRQHIGRTARRPPEERAGLGASQQACET